MVGAAQRLADVRRLAELGEVLPRAEAAADPEVRAVVITGAGRTSGSAASASASASRACSAALNALNTSGRLSVIVVTPPSRRVSTSAIPILL